jgi:hypothetical protein
MERWPAVLDREYTSLLEGAGAIDCKAGFVPMR